MLRDQNSSLEAAFLKLLYDTRRRLPDRTQYRPLDGVYAEGDFFYEPKSLPGVCVFCDGPDHDLRERKTNDEHQREKLRDLGYRVVEIRFNGDLEEQFTAHTDVFGTGVKAAGTVLT